MELRRFTDIISEISADEIRLKNTNPKKSIDMKVKILIGIILFLGLSAFVDLTPKKQEFGFYGCECSDSCAVVYGVTSNQLSLDYPTKFCSFIDTQISNKKRILHRNNNLKYLVDVPLIMFFEPRGSFGYPDSADQGGYYFSFEVLGIKRSFIFDTNKGYEPIYFKSILNEISQKMNDISSEFGK